MNLMSLLPMAALGFGLGLSLSPIRIAAAEAPIHGADRGRITLDAADAALSGPKLKRGTEDGVAVVSGWSEANDSVRWDFKPVRWGRYDVEVAYTAPGTDVLGFQVEVDGKTLSNRNQDRKGSANARRVEGLHVGRFYLARSEPFSVQLRGLNDAVVPGLSVRSVSLIPAPEGDSITQAADGVITLLSSQATTHSVMMRYEPATNKNCLGYWVNPSDWADWEFAVVRSGTFDIEVWQGCGRDQGGSDVTLEAGGEAFPFIVEETGHFQNFVPRRVGRVTLPAGGPQRLAVKPQRKQAGAVMDIRRIRLVPVTTAEIPAPPARAFVAARRVVILGDSITYGGEWAEWVETWLHLKFPEARFEFLNLGLPSETVSGLSEDNHAGGAFPRPGLHERLARVLEKTHPDLIVACYGMNDGIYFPFGEERFRKFQEGILQLREKAAHEGIRVIHLTPPVFDPVPLAGRTLPGGRDAYPSPFEGYNGVLDRYSEWLVSRRAAGWVVVDVHTPMNRFLADQRRANPEFILAGDGVHANAQGHWLIARELLRQLGAPDNIVTADTAAGLLQSDPRAAAVLALVQKRQRVLKDSWLTAVGHQRPGMAPGVPLADAERQAADIAAQLAVP